MYSCFSEAVIDVVFFKFQVVLGLLEGWSLPVHVLGDTRHRVLCGSVPTSILVLLLLFTSVHHVIFSCVRRRVAHQPLLSGLPCRLLLLSVVRSGAARQAAQGSPQTVR